MIEDHAEQARPSPGFCPPINGEELRQWWVDTPNPLLSEQSFDDLSEPGRCLAQIAVVNSRGLMSGPPSQWRDVKPGMDNWRERCDRLANNTTSRTKTWEAAAAVYFHSVAGMLKEWLKRQQQAPLTQDERDLGVYLRRVVEPLQRLYSHVELPLQDADPGYAESYAVYQQFYQSVGTQVSEPGLSGETRSQALPWLPLREWIAAQSGRSLARAICPADAVSVRDGLVEVISRAVSGMPQADDLPHAWNVIVQGPHALQKWLESAEGRTASARWVDAVEDSHVHGAAVDRKAPVDWQTRAALLRKAVLSQLPRAVRSHVPQLDTVPALYANGTAPVLGLAQTLATLDPQLLREPAQALMLAVALLPSAEPADAARMPLAFPLWPLETATSAPLDTRELPDLHTLLQGWGLDVLHTADPHAALHPADLWELVSRTPAFAELGQKLLQQTDWAGAQAGSPHSPQSAQWIVARALLEHYVGRAQIDTLRTQLNAPESVHLTFVQQQAQVHNTLVARQPHASAAAIGLLEWLVLRELDQPVLLVHDIPEGLHAGMLAGSAFAHSVQLLEALQPGASGRVSYAQVAGFAAELAAPPAHAGEKTALHDAWARAMLRPALAYAAAHGQLPGLTQLDRATAEQAQLALNFLQHAQEQHAANLARIDTVPPTRRGIAARTLGNAHVPENLWSLPVDQLPAGYLDTHGIVASPVLEAGTQFVDLLLPLIGTRDDRTLKATLSAHDSLQNLIAADAYVSTQLPTTKVLFNAAFDVYRRTVEQGLAGLIEAVLQSLPPEDQTLLQGSRCTPMQVKAFDQDARQGLLLQCQPPGNAEPVYFEVLPATGMARRAYIDPKLGPCVDAQGLIDGSLPVHRLDRIAPVSNLQLTPLANATDMSEAGALHGLSVNAAQHLWDPQLDTVKKQELERATPLEQVLHHEEELLKKAAEFAIPFFECGEDLLEGEKTKAAIACSTDAAGSIIPVFKAAGSMVHLMRNAGEHTVMSLAAHTGDALATLAREIAQNSGLVFLHQIGKGAVWLGGHAWNQALHGAGWLRTVLRGERALGAAAHGLENVIAQGKATPELLESFDVGEATLAVGHAGGDAPVLMVSGKDGWYRFDPIAKAGYGPRLEQVKLTHPLPAQIPTEQVEGGVRIHLGDATDARFVERTDARWEMWIDDTPYVLNPDDGSLRQRDLFGGQPGELEELDASGCRVPRGVDAVDAPGCSRPPRQLQFSPDRRVSLGTPPTPDELEPLAFGHQRIQLASVTPDRDLGALEELEDDHLEGLSSLWNDAPAETPLPAPEATRELTVYNGKVCQWHAPPSKQKGQAPLAWRLAPLTPKEIAEFGVPGRVEYLHIVGGEQVHGSRLGLPEGVDDAAAHAIEAKLPVIRLGPIVAGVEDSRELRGLLMPVGGVPSICVEADRGVYYAASIPAADSTEPLHFIRTKDKGDINRFLRESERLRLYRENPHAAQLRRNIAQMVFQYMKPDFSHAQLETFASYAAYEKHCLDKGKTNMLENYAEKVLSGKQQQDTFIKLARKLIPDWKMLQTCPLEERQEIADMLNTLLPLRGKEADWVPLTAESLALPETAHTLLQHVSGANFAFAVVETTQGKRVIASLSSGERARRLEIAVPPDTEGVSYFDARNSGLPALPELISLPVLRSHADGRTIIFDREGDSENWIVRKIMAMLGSGDPAIRLHPEQISKVKLFTLLGTCSSCGGVVLPYLKQKLAGLGADVKFSVRYLFHYVK